MDRHDAKPRRPSLMAGAEPQRPAPGPPAARILADVDLSPAKRKPRRSAHLRAALVAAMGLLAVAAVAWALISPGEEAPRAVMSAEPAAFDAPVPPSTATLVEAPAASAPVSNPFDSGAASAVPTVDAAVAAPVVAAGTVERPSPLLTRGVNPFSAMQATPSRTAPRPDVGRAAPAVASRPGAASRTAPAAPREASAKPSKDADLLQTLMDNIQPPQVPARDTRAMDRLAQRLDRTPMPETAASAAGVASTTSMTNAAAAPAAATPKSVPPAVTSERQNLRAMLDRCAASSSVQGQRCRRQLCERAGVDAHRCLRY